MEKYCEILHCLFRRAGSAVTVPEVLQECLPRLPVDGEMGVRCYVYDNTISKISKLHEFLAHHVTFTLTCHARQNTCYITMVMIQASTMIEFGV